RPPMHRRRKASVFMSFVTRREEFLQRNAWHRLAEFLDLGHHAIEFDLTTIRLRYDAGNRLAMSGNDNRLATFDRIEQAGQVRLGFGGLNFAHRTSVWTGQFDQSKYGKIRTERQHQFA